MATESGPVADGGRSEAGRRRMLLIAGKIDFYMCANTLLSFDRALAAPPGPEAA